MHLLGKTRRWLLEEAIDGLSSCVVPRYVPVLRHVPSNRLDRKGSLIGGCAFCSNAYPNPEVEGEPMAPLVQLDLDDIKLTTGVRVGSGLIQVWLPRDLWGQEMTSYVRNVPRDIVSKTKRLRRCIKPKIPPHIEHGCEDVDPALLEVIDPAAAEKLRYDIRYFGGTAGFDWGEVEQSVGPMPKQIDGWRKNGYVLPAFDEFDIDKWVNDRPGLGGVIRSLQQAADMAEQETRRKLALFEDDSADLSLSKHWPDEPPSVIDGWRPLLSFFGPISYDSQDDHVLFYRTRGDDFEYWAGCTRWN